MAWKAVEPLSGYSPYTPLSHLEALAYCTALRHKRTVKVMRAVRESYKYKVE